MKKYLLLTLLAIGINVSAFGVYYLHGTNSSQNSTHSPENEFSEVHEITEENAPNGHDKAKLWRAMAWKDENGQIPPNAISNAIKERDDYLEKEKEKEKQKQKPPKDIADGIDQVSISPGVANTNWSPIGPQNVGGRTNAVIVHPTNPSIIWTGTQGGGVWKSTDGGTTWNAMNGDLQNFTIASMAIDPKNPDILYAGTSLELFDGGIFKTIDGGMTWVHLAGTIPNPDKWNHVYQISIDPNNSDIILAATVGGLKRSSMAGAGSWVDVIPGVEQSYDVAFDPNNGSNAVAIVKTGSNYQIVYSTNSGEGWTNATLDSGVLDYTTKLAYSKSNSNIVYASFYEEVASSQENPKPKHNCIAVSNNGGHSFTKINSQSSELDDRGKVRLHTEGYFDALWVSPTNPNFILGGMRNLWKSTDGGANFTRISNGYILSTQPHSDTRFIVGDPSSSNRVYLGTDGGVYLTNDITMASFDPRPGHGDDSNGWVPKTFNYQTTQYYSVAGNSLTGLIFGGAQDNGNLRLGLPPTKQNAIFLFGGDGATAAVDPMDDNYCYGSYFNLALQRSTDCNIPNPTTGGYIWQGILVQTNPDVYTDGISDNYSNFIAPFILDPNNRYRMLWGGGSLWKTDNVRASVPTWTSIRAGSLDNNNISAIAMAKGYPNIIWIGQNNGQVYKTINGLDASPTWIPIDDNGSHNPLPNRMVTRILIDKDDPNIVYVSFGSFASGNLQRTYNGGTNWSPITGSGLPGVPIHAIARNPHNPNKLYIGTEIGIYRSEDIGTTWHAVVDGPANVSVFDLEYIGDSTTLVAATYGRGLWSNDEEASPSTRTLFDFDGDARADVSVFRPPISPSTDTNWYLDRSVAGFQGVQWGTNGDKPVARDYDGDRIADIAVWRPSNGYWYRLNSSNNTFVSVQWGQQGDVPVPADYDGDGKTDEAVFRPSAGTWQLNRSTLGYTSVSLGGVGDIPSPVDFDGDGKADQAVFRPSNVTWYLVQSTNGPQLPIQWGTQGDIPVAADYDGDGKADITVWRPSSATWLRLNRSNGMLASSVPWGLSTDIPVPADYDGDAKADVAVWRPSTGYWHLLESANGYKSEQFGSNGDIPIPVSATP